MNALRTILRISFQILGGTDGLATAAFLALLFGLAFGSIGLLVVFKVIPW